MSHQVVETTSTVAAAAAGRGGQQLEHAYTIVYKRMTVSCEPAAGRPVHHAARCKMKDVRAIYNSIVYASPLSPMLGASTTPLSSVA